MAAQAPPLFTHPLRPTALPALSAGFALLALFGLMLGLGEAEQPRVGLPLAGVGTAGALVCLVAALRAPRLLRITGDGLELVSAVGVHHAAWKEVRAVVRAEPRREVEVAAYALQLEGDREVWLLPTVETAPALRTWMDEVALRAGLVWVGHRALPGGHVHPLPLSREESTAGAAPRRRHGEGGGPEGAASA